MLTLVVILLLVSFSLNIAMFLKRLAHRKEIQYIEKKLRSIVVNSSDEKLLLYTNDKQIKALLIQINLLLEESQKATVDYRVLERSMRKMLSNISHDLKTPLTVILGYAENMMNDDDLDPHKVKASLQTVHLKTVEVLDLMKRFFELARLESGDNHAEIVKVDISEICRKIILDYYEILTRKDFEVAIEIPETPIFVWGNQISIERILNNLITNAIKYGADGKMIGLKVKTNNDHAYIEVMDKGKGISEINRDRVFERMYTLEDSRNKLYQGSGLGLTITKRLVEQLGGSISLDSEPFKKTVFTVALKRFNF
ncbi:sensor histidine kinase [Ureibacillus sinduriensis]|uniref:histidine kinase n=1 Tax=Ureibacillus sinduriensis BLB-1 = JCM 15800 TaxID=1384057 RepID=A0A0A3HV92_9BACL|nr:sensor histidine kinase [Ureibacillus sinduriensis]KGR75155.1 histidine kinase [Ureibacillus sinduriensis BLB-1 = JCM 15800]